MTKFAELYFPWMLNEDDYLLPEAKGVLECCAIIHWTLTAAVIAVPLFLLTHDIIFLQGVVGIEIGVVLVAIGIGIIRGIM
jgi:hypothetical protein